MKKEPYLSLDIETTGLNLEKSQILSVGLVWDDRVSSLDKLKKFYCIIDNEIINYAESYALGLNSSLLEFIKNNKICCLSLEQAKKAINNFIEEVSEGKSVFVAGKNVANFDMPVLKSNGFYFKHKHRFLDVGSMYFNKFGYCPSLQEINNSIGYGEVAHTALEDALNVVVAIRGICD